MQLLPGALKKQADMAHPDRVANTPDDATVCDKPRLPLLPKDASFFGKFLRPSRA